MFTGAVDNGAVTRGNDEFTVGAVARETTGSIAMKQIARCRVLHRPAPRRTADNVRQLSRRPASFTRIRSVLMNHS